MIFQCLHCGACCGPVPVTKIELEKIKKAIKELPTEERERLAKQQRGYFTCSLYDTDNDMCGLYDAKPILCEMFGYYEGLKCPNNKGVELKPREESYKHLSYTDCEGILGETITWEDGLL